MNPAIYKQRLPGDKPGFVGKQPPRVLPNVDHIHSVSDKAELRGSIQKLMREPKTPQPGSSLIAKHLAEALLIETLRLHLGGTQSDRTGWLSALADPQLQQVLSAMHAEPGRKWTLEELARIAGMSRSSFAAPFREVLGEPALTYLTRWRMMVAADRLANRQLPISIVALMVGYVSKSAFGAAFKRIMGYPPGRSGKEGARSVVPVETA